MAWSTAQTLNSNVITRMAKTKLIPTRQHSGRRHSLEKMNNSFCDDIIAPSPSTNYHRQHQSLEYCGTRCIGISNSTYHNHHSNSIFIENKSIRAGKESSSDNYLTRRQSNEFSTPSKSPEDEYENAVNFLMKFRDNQAMESVQSHCSSSTLCSIDESSSPLEEQREKGSVNESFLYCKKSTKSLSKKQSVFDLSSLVSDEDDFISTKNVESNTMDNSEDNPAYGQFQEIVDNKFKQSGDYFGFVGGMSHKKYMRVRSAI